MSKVFLLALLAAFAYFFARTLFKPVRKPGQKPHFHKSRSEPDTEMVQDPVCGVFIEPGRAKSCEREGRRYYFCSPDCERKFLNQIQQGEKA